MALTRILGTAVRHPLASTALIAGVAKGTLVVVRRLARGETPLPTLGEEPPSALVTSRDSEGRDLPEPVVIYAADEPEPAPEVDLHEADELVWTSESTVPASD